ncbi:MAG: protein arginine kinase [Clostridia bacterium]|nr:protein arginine kinase [Clostridia bacterium]
MLNWYLQSGKDSDIVTSTRIRIARNIKGNKFPKNASKEEREKILNIIQEITPKIGYGLKFLKLKDMDDLTKLALIEKHLISPEFAVNHEDGAILINNDENICIMINEEDHLRIQVFSAGLELESSLNLAIEIEKTIGSLVNFAYSDKYGYLTECPTNVGTGLRASVMVHLPALTATRNINKVLDVTNNFGMNIRGLYGEGSNTQGNIYQISNKQSLGISEKEIINSINLITNKIIEQERTARKYLAKKSIELEDRLYRAYGVLTNCRKISSEEAKKLISDVRLGTDLGIIKEMTDLKVNKLDLYTKPANLQIYLEQELDEKQRDIERAEVIKKIINEE